MTTLSGGDVEPRAGDGIRTHDNNVGNVVLYQLSYTRNGPTPSLGSHRLDTINRTFHATAALEGLDEGVFAFALVSCQKNRVSTEKPR